MRITPDALRRVRAGHPWVYDRSIVSVAREGAPGDLAVVFDDDRRFAAIGLWDPTSPIRLKVLHHGRPTTVDRAFWRERLTAAIARRTPIVERGDTTGYRVVNGENDAMPGFILDRYDRTLVAKVYTAAWIPHLADIVAVVDELVHPDALVLVVVMPLYARSHRPFVTPDPVEVGRFFVAARRALPATSGTRSRAHASLSR